MLDLNDFLPRLETLVNIDSGQDCPEGIGLVAEHITEYLRQTGWILEKHDLEPYTGPCLIAKNREAAFYDVMLVGHMDTVFSTGTTAQWPFRTDGTQAYGPGVCDMKQGCLMMCYLAKHLSLQSNRLLNILLVFNPDEEIFSPYSRTIIDYYAERTKYALLFEAALEDGSSCIQRKGVIRRKVCFFGDSGHAGYLFERNLHSANHEMAYWAGQLYALSDQTTGTTVNIGVLKGGTACNVVASSAEMTFEARMELPDELQRVEATLQDVTVHAVSSGIQVSVHTLNGFDSVPPLVPNQRALHLAALAGEEAERLGLPFSIRQRGGISDANHIAQAGTGCLDGLGGVGGDDHSHAEWLRLDTVEPFFYISQAVLDRLAKEKASGVWDDIP